MLLPLTNDLKNSTGAISVITAQIPNLTFWGTSELTLGKSVTGALFALIVLANAQTYGDIYGFMPWGFPMIPCSAASVTSLLPLLSALPCTFWTAILQTPTSMRRNQLKTHLPLTKLKDQQFHLTSTWYLYSPKVWAFILFLSLIIYQEVSQVASVFVWQALLNFLSSRQPHTPVKCYIVQINPDIYCTNILILFSVSQVLKVLRNSRNLCSKTEVF